MSNILLFFQISFLPLGTEDAKQVIEALKCKRLSSIGAASFCWGGELAFGEIFSKVVVELAKYAYVQATVLLHPAFVSWQDVQGMYSITEPFPFIIFLISFR
ncbi:hypothetical protein RHMOL_Rhmol08G0107300 [Rhododendron molle]|uniref:Uncharacterized protein n=1 Tax=Rhododendron molle TaxID=49168 RepID=A0ACC0MMP1_RHOML|nr:hypothetical protein RHMOL_Rhmol08G0107300 [Rhododendron molle]